jgi:hypothetical protein
VDGKGGCKSRSIAAELLERREKGGGGGGRGGSSPMLLVMTVDADTAVLLRLALVQRAAGAEELVEQA